MLWLDGDQFDSWDELLEHLWMTGVTEPYDDGFYLYKGRPFLPEELIEILTPLVELNAQLYDAWALLYQVRDLPEECALDEYIPDDKEEAYQMGYQDAITNGDDGKLKPLKEKIAEYLDNPIGWKKE